MDLNKSFDKDGHKAEFEEQDEDSVELPADTLAILRDFMQNKQTQVLSECDMVEEDWVNTYK